MKLTRHPKNPILKSNPRLAWEAGAVFNPSVIYDKEIFHMLYRAIASSFKPKPGGGYTNYISSIGYAVSKDGIHFEKKSRPLIKPDRPWDKFGCEDPRVTKFEGVYYILYTAMSKPAYSEREIPGIALATTKDFKKIHKHGFIGPAPEQVRAKAAAIFPEKINGKIGVLFTWHPDKSDSSILYTEFKNINELLSPPNDYWSKVFGSFDKQAVLLPPRDSLRGPELGAPPIKTKNGWLLIYCGPAKEKRVWPIHAALLDLKNPKHVLAYTKNPILKPEEKYELRGLVNNVTFPEGAVVVEDKLYVYYGGADSSCCLAICNLNRLLDYLIKLAS